LFPLRRFELYGYNWYTTVASGSQTLLGLARSSEYFVHGAIDLIGSSLPLWSWLLADL
jgi:hypothetical protein